MSQYIQPKNEIFDLRSENLMIDGMSVGSKVDGGNGVADAPARRGRPIE